MNPVNAWTRVYVHLPDHGAHTQQARYEIRQPNGQTKFRVIPTRLEQNTWVEIGVFDFRGTGAATIRLDNFTRDGYGIHDVAWDAIAVQPLPAKPKHFVVAMGDSYSSGDGTGNYYPGTNQYAPERYAGGSNWNACRRSPQTWSRQVRLTGAGGRTIGQLADARDPDLDFHLLACSGAETENILPEGTSNGMNNVATSDHRDFGQYGELTQIDRGYLDADTTLVVLSLGGNDAGFKTIMPLCLAESLQCHDSAEARQAVNDIPTRVRGAIKMTMEAILRAAPNARVMLMGYPRLFQEHLTCGSGVLTWDETEFLNDMADRIADNTVSAPDVVDPLGASRSMGVRVIDDFVSEHRLCGPEGSHSGQQFNGLLLELDGGQFENDDGDPFDGVNMDTFHPNPAGYQHYGDIATGWLDLWGYRW